MIIYSNSLISISKTGLLVHLNDDHNSLCTMPFSRIENIHIDSNGSIILCYDKAFKRLHTNNKKDFDHLCLAFADFKTQELLEKMIISNPIDSIEVLQSKAKQIIYSYYITKT